MQSIENENEVWIFNSYEHRKWERYEHTLVCDWAQILKQRRTLKQKVLLKEVDGSKMLVMQGVLNEYDMSIP